MPLKEVLEDLCVTWPLCSRQELSLLQKGEYACKYPTAYIVAVESTLLGIIPVTGSELLDVQFQRWWIWIGHPVPCPLSFFLLGTFLALLFQQQLSLLCCWSDMEPLGFSSLVSFWQVKRKKKKKGCDACHPVREGRLPSFSVFGLFRLKCLSVTHTRVPVFLEGKEYLHHCVLYRKMTGESNRLGAESIKFLPSSGNCHEVELS